MPSTPTTHELGAFAAGEVPPPLEVHFTDFDSQDVDLTGFTNLQCNIEEELAGYTSFGTGALACPTPANGKVTYTWVRADMFTVGEYTLQVWADNGTNYYASDLYLYSVYDGPGEPPT